MITLTAEIELPKSGGSLNGVSANGENSSYSSPISSVLNKTAKTAKNPFVLGATKLGEVATFYSGKLDYFVGKNFSRRSFVLGESRLGDNSSFQSQKYWRSANNFYVEELTISIDCSNAEKCTIVFDKQNNGYPTEIEVDGKKVEVFGVYADIFFEDSALQTHKIKIDNWNLPNKPISIMGIYIEKTFAVGKESILSCETEIRERADVDKPSFGLISNGGNISFKDHNSRFLGYANAGLLTDGVKIDIFLENTITKNREQVGSYFSTDWDYDNDNRSVSVSFDDGLKNLQNILVEDYDKREIKEEYAKDIFYYLKEKSKENGNIVYADPYYSEFVLKDFIIKYPYIKNGTLWSQWNKFCQAFLSSMFVGKYGYIEVVPLSYQLLQ
jgi:hypothetical protein